MLLSLAFRRGRRETIRAGDRSSSPRFWFGSMTEDPSGAPWPHRQPALSSHGSEGPRHLTETWRRASHRSLPGSDDDSDPRGCGLVRVNSSGQRGKSHPNPQVRVPRPIDATAPPDGAASSSRCEKWPASSLLPVHAVLVMTASSCEVPGGGARRSGRCHRARAPSPRRSSLGNSPPPSV